MESIAALTDHFSDALFAKTLCFSMMLWRHNDKRKFDADAICLEKYSVRKWIF